MILTVNDGGDVTATGGNGGNGGTRGGMHEEGAENAGAQGASGVYGYAITSSCTQNVSENATTAINNGTIGSQGTGTNWC